VTPVAGKMPALPGVRPRRRSLNTWQSYLPKSPMSICQEDQQPGICAAQYRHNPEVLR
jgi:hypothetical protein